MKLGLNFSRNFINFFYLDEMLIELSRIMDILIDFGEI